MKIFNCLLQLQNSRVKHPADLCQYLTVPLYCSYIRFPKKVQIGPESLQFDLKSVEVKTVLCTMCIYNRFLGVGGDDDSLSVYPFLEALNARNAPLLAGKPKLIFIQACRGGNTLRVVAFLREPQACRPLLAYKISHVGQCALIRSLLKSCGARRDQRYPR
ncbi:unnamed protein product [Heligmosomoides polygyrus]|uniref:Caspase family p20 domain-containing protein n=1 Tax=Heligmosomoides polygyrus TaxID=6339 RepID=A0A3P7U0N1_HELPZ|nr:unnamed protein product [Heligmosomoides polygyrus]